MVFSVDVTRELFCPMYRIVTLTEHYSVKEEFAVFRSDPVAVGGVE